MTGHATHTSGANPPDASSNRVTHVRCNHCHGRGTVKPAGGISRVCAWCDGLGFEKQDAIPNSAADPYLDTSTTSKARNATLRRLRADVDATRNSAARIRQALLDVNEQGETRRWSDPIDVLVAHIQVALDA